MFHISMPSLQPCPCSILGCYLPWLKPKIGSGPGRIRRVEGGGVTGSFIECSISSQADPSHRTEQSKPPGEGGWWCEGQRELLARTGCGFPKNITCWVACHGGGEGRRFLGGPDMGLVPAWHGTFWQTWFLALFDLVFWHSIWPADRLTQKHCFYLGKTMFFRPAMVFGLTWNGFWPGLALVIVFAW